MSEQKKVSLQDLVKQQLANKKNQSKANAASQGPGNEKKMKSQQAKKVANTRRKAGGS
ncbi:hypothetical protein [Jeotgalibacillus proteolyticus]|uniref:hypothetical protein n=1 Tax=Jeotgalibacillus proteolyticus TaxID=2082395 RepID=UPI003CEB0C6F